MIFFSFFSYHFVASVFGEQWRLEPMSVERKARWRKEIDLLLSVTDYIVEFVPSQQKSKDGTNMEAIISLSLSDLQNKNKQKCKKMKLLTIIHFTLFDLTDHGYPSTQRSSHEHPSTAEA